MSDPATAILARHPQADTIELLLPDLVGVPRGKRVGRDALAGLLAGQGVFTTSLYAVDTTGANVDRSGLVWEEGDADRPLYLDPRTLRPVPWRETALQVVGGLRDHDGSPFFADPRAILERVTARLVAQGVRPVAALELEFYLLGEADPARGGGPALATSGRHGAPPAEGEVWTHEKLDDHEAFFALVERWCGVQGLPYKGAIAEFSPGQFEVNLGHRDDMLEAADETLAFKRLIKAAARATGRRASFMAKPFADRSGSGLHVHVSLVDAQGRNLLAAGADGAVLMRRAIGGLQATMAEAMALWAPNANGYRRLRPLSYAPTAPTWGWNNRTVALRIPKGPDAARRIEHRVAGADANPYLVLAAVLAGIGHGLEQGLEAGPPVTGNAYDQVPSSLPTGWAEAIAAWRRGTVLRDWLGERFVELYATHREAERQRFEAIVTPTEHAWYLTTV